MMFSNSRLTFRKHSIYLFPTFDICFFCKEAQKKSLWLPPFPILKPICQIPNFYTYILGYWRCLWGNIPKSRESLIWIFRFCRFFKYLFEYSCFLKPFLDMYFNFLVIFISRLELMEHQQMTLNPKWWNSFSRHFAETVAPTLWQGCQKKQKEFFPKLWNFGQCYKGPLPRIRLKMLSRRKPDSEEKLWQIYNYLSDLLFLSDFIIVLNAPCAFLEI